VKDTCTRNNIGDFSARYLDTLCWYTTSTGKTIPVYISEINAEQVGFRDVHGNQYYNEIGETCQFDYDQVAAGWYVDPKRGPLFLARRPARQWKRGICSANTSMYLLPPPGSGVLVFIDWSFDTLARALVHTENLPSIEKQFQLYGGARLSSLILLTQQSIFMKEHQVALVHQYDPSSLSVTVSMVYPMFKQEIMDACRDAGIQLSFKD
jgi:hypothetical protein